MPRGGFAMNKKKDEPQAVERTTLSLSITVEDKKRLKKYAVDHDTTVAALIHNWIEKNCGRE